MVSEALAKPKDSNWRAVKRIFRYLKGTSDHGILYDTNKKGSGLKSYSDADYAGDINSRRSRSGTVCMFSGRAITWMSRKQNCVVLSTTEAEYIAASEGVKEVIWLKLARYAHTSYRQCECNKIGEKSRIPQAI